MPELPEVETIRLGLQKKITGLKIRKIKVLNSKTFIGDQKLASGKKVLNIWRRAKVLGIDLTGNLSLLFHLKMSGQLIWIGNRLQAIGTRFVGGHPTQDMAGVLPNKSTRVVFTFSDNSKLYFNDQRKFGWVKLVKSDELRDQNFLKSLGPEPLEKNFTWHILKSYLLNRKSLPIKVALLDQSIVSGIGNIYASEACFNAKVSPQIRVRDLSDKQIKRLHQGIIKALRDGIKYGGSSRAHFVDSEGKKGYFLDYAFVYGRDKKPCKVCKTEIKKIQLGGRGTYYCESCQKIESDV